MYRYGSKKWTDKLTEATAASLIRSNGCVLNGLQFGPGSYAADGVTTYPAASLPTATVALLPSPIGLFAVARYPYPANTHIRVALSPDGFEPYVDLLFEETQYVHSTLPVAIHCGGDRIVVAEYGGDGTGSKLWYSGDRGATWSTLFTTAADSIRHFHGGMYDSDYERLYVFTGDTNAQSSILWTDDVDSLGANPTLWQARWGLSDATRSTLDEDWVIGHGSQRYRSVFMIPHGDYLYWGADTASSGLTVVSRAHRDTLAVENVWVKQHHAAIVDGTAGPETWTWGHANDGTLLMSHLARPTTTPYFSSGYMHLYSLDHDGLTMYEIERAELDVGSSGLAPHSIHTVGGYTIVPSFSTASCRFAGTVHEQVVTAKTAPLITRGLGFHPRFLVLGGWTVARNITGRADYSVPANKPHFRVRDNRLVFPVADDKLHYRERG